MAYLPCEDVVTGAAKKSPLAFFYVKDGVITEKSLIFAPDTS